MHHRVATPLSIAIVLVLLSVSSLIAGKKKTLEDVCLESLERMQSFYPVHSTEMGIHAYDHRLTDYSSKSVKAAVKDFKSLSKKLFKFEKTDLTDQQRLSSRLVRANLDIAVLDLTGIKWYKRNPQLYVDEAVNGLYFLMLAKHAPLNERLYSIIKRMKTVSGLLTTARRNISKPPQVWVEAALESLESGQEFYRQVAGELMKQFPDRADEILKVSTAAREAMNDFAIHISDIEQGDSTSFAIGREHFDFKLTNEYFLDYDSDSLLKIGEGLLTEVLTEQAEYREYVDSHHQNGEDSVYVPRVFTKDDILDYYHWETEQTKKFLKINDLLTVPEDIAPVLVVETPPFLRSMISGIAYQPAGPFDSVQQGIFYVRPISDDLDRQQLEARYRYVHRRGFRGSVVHEAFPGHHLQLQLAADHPDPVRKWQLNIMLIEGWALYCEEMMYREGLYGDEDPAHWLGVLGGIAFRAARIVVDVKLHTGQFTYDQAVQFMIDTLDVDTESGREYIRKEVRRYTTSPTYQMSYLMGKREIMALREAAKVRDGESFSLKQFHDRLLAEGSVPVALMWGIMGLDKD